MFDHVTVRAADRDASVRFYETLLPGEVVRDPDGNDVEVLD